MQEKVTTRQSAGKWAKMMRFIRNNLNPWEVARYFCETKTESKEQSAQFDTKAPPWHRITEPVAFELGRIYVSQNTLEQVTHEEIAYCLDGHRRCQSHDMIGEHIETLAFGGCKVKTHFHFPREDMVCGEEEVVVVVVTSQSRMRTVVRLYEEPLRERRNHLKKTVEPLAESNSVESYTATQRSNT